MKIEYKSRELERVCLDARQKVSNMLQWAGDEISDKQGMKRIPCFFQENDIGVCPNLPAVVEWLQEPQQSCGIDGKYEEIPQGKIMEG